MVSGSPGIESSELREPADTEREGRLAMASHAGPLEPVDQEAIDPRAIGIGVRDENIAPGAHAPLIAGFLARFDAHLLRL